MRIEVRLIRELPIGGNGYVSRIALCDQEGGDGLKVRLAHIVHAAPGGDAEVPIRRTEQGYTIWLPAGFEAKGQPHGGEELAMVTVGDIGQIPADAARYWGANSLMPEA